jgi:uncharacterized damage-inducible protein DinB
MSKTEDKRTESEKKEKAGGVVEDRFIEEADEYLGEYLRKIEHCTSLLTEVQMWWKPNEACNSVGNLLLHLRGNLSQWVLGGIGGEAIERHRSAEFAARETAAKSDLLAGLADAVARARITIREMRSADLARAIRVQGYDTNGLRVVFHVVEHMAYHTGQIVAVTKQLLGPAANIEFYPQHRGE